MWSLVLTLLSLQAARPDVAAVRHPHHQRHPVRGGVRQAHLWFHGPLSERPDHSPQSRWDESSAQLRGTTVRCERERLRRPQRRSDPAVLLFVAGQCSGGDTATCCPMNSALASSGGCLHGSLSHAEQHDLKRCASEEWRALFGGRNPLLTPSLPPLIRRASIYTTRGLHEFGVLKI